MLPHLKSPPPPACDDECEGLGRRRADVILRPRTPVPCIDLDRYARLTVLPPLNTRALSLHDPAFQTDTGGLTVTAHVRAET